MFLDTYFNTHLYGSSTAVSFCKLELYFTCTVAHFTGEQCQEGMLFVACDPSESIEITNVFYGREDNTTCGGRNDSVIGQSETCKSANASDVVKQLCNGRSYCELYATSGLFGNICPNTHKYLQVEYMCGSKFRISCFSSFFFGQFEKKR